MPAGPSVSANQPANTLAALGVRSRYTRFPLVGDGIEIERRIGLSQPSHAPRQLRPKRVIGAKPARVHLPHCKHRQRADDDLTRRDSIAEGDDLARRDVFVANAHSAPLPDDVLRVRHEARPGIV